MEDWLKCQISPLVKYRQNQNCIPPIVLTLLQAELADFENFRDFDSFIFKLLLTLTFFIEL